MTNHTNAVDRALGLGDGARYEADLTDALGRLEQADAQLAVAILDVDNLEAMNRAHGLEAVDRALIALGRHMQQSLPEGARLYRVHGDEFAALFPFGMEKEEVFLLIEDARRSLDIKMPDGAAFTFTAGVAAAPEDGERYHELMRKADGAMYRGKQAGRNRVCLAREEKMVTKTSHYTTEQLQKLTKLSKSSGIGEAVLLREALDDLLKKYDPQRPAYLTP